MKKYLIAFFVLGIIFRLWLTQLIPQTFVADQEEYHQAALGLIGYPEYNHISSYRVWGYPMLLGGIYGIFGIKDIWGWKAVQAVMDSLCAVMVFGMALKLFNNKKVAWISFLLYLFNPFTSAFVGVRLTEIAAIFLVCAASYLFLKFLKTRTHFFLFLSAIVLGYLPFVRPGYLFFSLLLMGFLIIKALIQMKGVVFRVVLTSLALLTFLSFFIFNMARNNIYFKQAAFLTVDNLFVREFYLSLFIDNFDNMENFPIQASMMYQEYSTAQNAKERDKMASKYLALAKEEILRDPVKFAVSRVKKLWPVWEKHTIFPYVNPENILLTEVLYWANKFLVIAAIAGGVMAFLKTKDKLFAAFFFFLMIYISVLHAFTVTAERFSLPAYPLIFLFAGYGFYKLAVKIFLLAR